MSLSASEKLIAEMWSALLATEIIDPATNFFEAGGDSFFALVFSTYLRERYNIEIEGALLFEAPTVREFAHRIESLLPLEAGGDLIEDAF